MDHTPNLETVTAAISSFVPTDYHRLVLIHSGSGAERSALLEAAAAKLVVPYINVGLELSNALLDIPARYRAARVSRILTDLIPDDATVVVLDRIEILFEPTLKIQPLAMLRSLSRARVVVAPWPGLVDARRLIYADHSHPEHLDEPASDVRLIETS